MNPDTESQHDLLTGYARDGYVHLPGFVSGEALAELLSHLDRFISEVTPGMPPEQVFFEDGLSLLPLLEGSGSIERDAL